MNIEVEIDTTDKSPFFIIPYDVKEEDKNILDKEMKRLFYLGILKECFSAYSSPVMLISRKVTKDHRVLTIKCENSKEQLGLSLIERHIFCVR